MSRRWTTFTFAILAAVAAGIGHNAPAQSTLRSGDGLLEVRTSFPESARVNEQFTYDVTVTNTSDDIVLHDIELVQGSAQGFTIESVTTPESSGKASKSQSRATSKDATPKDEDKASDAGNSEKQSSADSGTDNEDDSGKKKSDSSNTSQQAKKKKGSNDKGNSGNASHGERMRIATLQPNATHTFQVKASADAEGTLKSCLEIAKYTPTLCLTSKIVKPELELTKTAPKQVNRCDVIELTYELKNSGTGDVGALTITDSLDKGLATIRGDRELKFSVDGLDAGESRQFVARVYAQDVGTYSSRAKANANESDLSSRSQATKTKVIAADLRAELDGPSHLSPNDVATFTATVTNVGNSTANDIEVDVSWPNDAMLADLGEPKVTQKHDKSAESQKPSGNEPTAAKRDQSGSEKSSGSEDTSTKSSANQSNSNQADSKSSESNSETDDSESSTQDGNDQNNDDSKSMQMQQERVVIDQLKPGETAEFTYAIRPGKTDKLPSAIKATYVCNVDEAESESKAQARVTASSQASAKVIRLPALQLVVVDDEDPVMKDDKVTYTIRVWNEGNAADSNVQLKVDVPGALTFVSADGPTKHEQQGDSVTFSPIESMEAGDRVDFTVTAELNGSGSPGTVELAATITSDSLNQEVTSQEPTRLFVSADQ